jgi:hypothetical protein
MLELNRVYGNSDEWDPLSGDVANDVTVKDD